MLASEDDHLEEGGSLLRRAISADPSMANGHVALGVAALRQGGQSEARQALERAVELVPQNPFALCSLASLLVSAGALALPPGALIAALNLAQVLMELDPEQPRDEAGRRLLRLNEAQPYGELAARAKELRGSMASRDLRADQPDGLRQDAVSY